MTEIMIIVLSYIAFATFFYLYLSNYSQYFHYRKRAWISIVFLFIVGILPLLNLTWYEDHALLKLAIPSFVYFIAFPFIFRTSLLNSIFLSLNFIVKTYCTLLFFSSLFAIVDDKILSTSWISPRTNPEYYYLTNLCASVLASLSILLLDKLLLNNKLKDFFASRKLVWFIISIQLIMVFNLLIISTGQFYNFEDAWYNVAVLIASSSVFIIYFVIRLFSANISNLSGYKNQSLILETQLKIQIDHYHVYERQVKQYLRFKHDYNKTLKALSLLMEKENYSGVNNVISSSISDLNTIKLRYKEYSNNIIIDALLNDYASRFKLINCTFESTAFLSLDLPISELELIKLFSNILDNCYEAVSKVAENENRFVTIKSSTNNNFQLLTITNSSDGVPLREKTKTSKKNRLLHGFGLSIISDIMESIGGFVLYKKSIHQTVPSFQIVLHIPLIEKD